MTSVNESHQQSMTPEALFKHGVACVDAKAYDEGAAIFLGLLKHINNSPALWQNAGICLQEQGKILEAITAYRRCLALDSTVASVWNNLGEALRGEKRYSESITCLRNAIELASLLAGPYEQGPGRDVAGNELEVPGELA